MSRPGAPGPARTGSGIDLSVVMPLHAESVVAGPTFQSIEAALEPVIDAGYRVERLIGLDGPTPECRAFVEQPLLSSWQISEHEFRDQGRTRNAVVERARGRWVALMDGDDLCSRNWLVEAIRLLEEAEADGRRIIVHPELNWQFDAGASIYTNPAQDDPLFSPFYLGSLNYYDALCVAPRAAWRQVPYVDRDISSGFAFEDWQWSIETMEQGWFHAVARDTVIFKRRRDSSQTHQSKDRKALIRAVDATAIDRIGQLGRSETDGPAGTGVPDEDPVPETGT